MFNKAEKKLLEQIVNRINHFVVLIKIKKKIINLLSFAMIMDMAKKIIKTRRSITHTDQNNSERITSFQRTFFKK